MPRLLQNTSDHSCYIPTCREAFEPVANKNGFTTKSMEILITDWLELWFSARQARLYGIANKNPILETTDKPTEYEQWSPFGPLQI